jgi:Flp pilus assembly protein TadD
LLEKAPFIFLTIVSGIVTLWAQHKGGAVVSMEGLHFPDRVANAVISYVSYLGKLFWPVDLVVFYPFEYTFPLWHFLIFCFILIVITSAVIYTVKKLPFLFTGWFWYLGTLVPVIGLVQVGEQSMADRYTYLPSIGIAIMLAWGIPLFFRSADMRKKILFPAGAAVLIIITALTWYQCGYWKSDFKLFNHALQLTKNNYFVHNVLGLSLLNKDKMEEAIEHFNEVIRLRPNYILPYCSRGKAYAKLGQYQRAVEDYNEAIRREPDYAEAYNYRGIAYGKLGQQQHAIEDYSRAIVLKPDYSDAYNNRGYAYAMSGQYQRAIEDYNETIRLQPDALAYINRGAAYLSRGNSELGCRDAQMACVLGSCELLEGAKGRGFCR